MYSREDFYENGILMKYIEVRYDEKADYRQIITHSYCPYRNKSGTIEHATFTSRWEDNRGNYETFAWDEAKNGVVRIDSYAALYVDGKRYFDRASYLKAYQTKHAVRIMEEFLLGDHIIKSDKLKSILYGGVEGHT